jgi:hypothetical protein
MNKIIESKLRKVTNNKLAKDKLKKKNEVVLLKQNLCLVEK